jgi:hypothetical protein
LLRMKDRLLQATSRTLHDAVSHSFDCITATCEHEWMSCSAGTILSRLPARKGSVWWI